MKINSYVIVLLFPLFSLAQLNGSPNTVDASLEVKKGGNYTMPSAQLSLKGAFQITEQARSAATLLGKNVTIAILDASGQLIMLTRGDEVGPHNTEAARRKAYTALSTKTPTLLLSRNARSNPDTQNLVTLPELLLLGGGNPLWYNGKVIGSIGIAGGGSPENDDLISRSAAIISAGITTN